VEAVWCDMRSEDSSQQFVLWAGAVLDQRASFEASLQGRRFAFSLLAHSDQSSPMLDFLSSSSVLQVGACSWAGAGVCWAGVGLGLWLRDGGERGSAAGGKAASPRAHLEMEGLAAGQTLPARLPACLFDLAPASPPLWHWRCRCGATVRPHTSWTFSAPAPA
jgi:hypothetical protein